MKSIKTSKLIAQESIATSITISPIMGGHGYAITYFLKERTKGGRARKKEIVVGNIIEDVLIPEIDNRNVAHLGYGKHQYYQPIPKGFYINFYKTN